MHTIKTLAILLLLTCTIQLRGQNIEITPKLHLRPIAENVYMHTSYLTLDDGIEFPCNGLVVIKNEQAHLIDLPLDNELTGTLIDFLINDLGVKVQSAQISHFHGDAMGGLEEVQNRGIYHQAHKKTRDLAKKNDLPIPENSVESAELQLTDDASIIMTYHGKAHSSDNTVFYLTEQKILFGGCMIKAIGAEEGNVEDASLKDWSTTVEKVAAAYPDAQMIIPGHGEPGGRELLDYTIELFDNYR